LEELQKRQMNMDFWNDLKWNLENVRTGGCVGVCWMVGVESNHRLGQMVAANRRWEEFVSLLFTLAFTGTEAFSSLRNQLQWPRSRVLWGAMRYSESSKDWQK
jgi:hypothetical protein